MLTIPCYVLDPVRSWVIQNAIKERVGIETIALVPGCERAKAWPREDITEL
jgi:hypothetical protein